MTNRLTGTRVAQRMSALLSGPRKLALLPVLSLLAYRLGGEVWLVITALTVPFLVALNSYQSGKHAQSEAARLDPVSFGNRCDQALRLARDSGRVGACLYIHIEGLTDKDKGGHKKSAGAIRRKLLDRVRTVLRPEDQVVWIGPLRMGVILSPTPQMANGPLMALARRVQAALEEPLSVEGQGFYGAAAIGGVLSASIPAGSGGRTFAEGAATALETALRHGKSSIRIPSSTDTGLKPLSFTAPEVLEALASGQIQPWFQPQVDTDTGQISGVEALARWHRPGSGLVPPSAFLPALEQAGAMEQLGNAILTQSLMALATWDRKGLSIPSVSINLSDAELRNPGLADKILWELDRFDLPPQRLTLEVLETVVTDGPDDTCRLMIDRLARAGCRIDLDDFGTGNASITALQRLTLHRLKIDRSFVSRIDLEENRHRLLAALLGMAERLGLETVAEGVETTGEHALLAQLGCRHVQGFGIARPMPSDKLAAWAEEHAKRRPPVAIPRRSGSSRA